MKRTHFCGQLRKENIGEEVVLNGWVQKSRDLGPLVFIDLRDKFGIAQIVFKKEDNEELYNKAKELKSEYVVGVRGKVFERESKNKDIPTGDVEIISSELVVYDTSKTPPIYIKDNDNASEEMRLKYRYLDLRKLSMQKMLRDRAEIVKAFRDFLYDNEFIEVETPMLTKPTPEGARDYIVPSRISKHGFYALPQSPQLFKQILMVAGTDRYYQIVKCFRDEDLRANRQPEFTQVDLEMSFVDEEDVMEINEKLIQYIFKRVKGIDLKLPFNRMSYDDAMSRFGSDKPDLRYGFEIKDISDLSDKIEFNLFTDSVNENKKIKAINFNGLSSKYSRKQIDKITSSMKGMGASGLIWFRYENGEINSSINKFLNEEYNDSLIERLELKDGDLALVIIDKEPKVSELMGSLRVMIASENIEFKEDEFAITWINEFPMFEYDDEENRYVAKHHPFTHPVDEDIKLLDSNPEKMRAKAYDLVINGDEIGGGSIRINNSDLQNKIFNALKLSKEDIERKFGFFVESLSYGTPPHGGLAFGLDRLVMTLLNKDNIKDVIAFPKTQSASCLLTEAPTTIDKKQLDELNIRFVED
ncbi:aspartate--tRNA ligase [Helcococcus ovis]|uniref:Aspartate--tRNA ligase n=1 Tax=Helcococcus ovis TaxID=72026 RepID=A0A4V3IY48_9FIRM|nr:aspartate--tRNA ligase [Helcococcus ovis]TFF64465.1 aspartate--tRNA ligase [Helcococcus ovis]TFF64687.1 aspartate--tRNA ligase [Helcococcus ovis]TFF68111.1 aspartate--tRNA ligase [Helcococcus ovis]WNZ01968.1 aspartate--tRNA ligase [Helcococcus ovis]